MDKTKLLNGLNRIESLIPAKTPEIAKAKSDSGGVSFDETLKQRLQPELGNFDKGSVEQGLKNSLDTSSLKFSNHAIERMQTRGISYGPESLAKLDEAIKKAASKGSKDALVLMNDSALIVSVKNNTVVTVMDKNSLKENVFTNIDSTVVL